MPSVTPYPAMSHYAAVGRVASKWAQLEYQIQKLIWGLVGLDETTGTCITSQIGHSGRLMDALLALLEQKGVPQDELKPLRSLSDDVGAKQRMRNRMVHDPWYFHYNEDGTTTGFRFEQSAVKRVVRGLVEQDEEKLETLIKDIGRLHQQLTQLVAPWIAAPPPDNAA